LFVPSLDSIALYKEQLTALLKSNRGRTETIDMGFLPKIYTVLGISDKQLKTNGKTIFKALGIEGRNKHKVSMKTIENLLNLAYDPEAIFKSLSVSKNPDAYIAVLNAKAENQEQVIAILSPSFDKKGFTFIPSVYEKHNFNKFLERIHKEQKILYIKSKGSELWGQLQSLPRHNSEPYTKNILTKDDVVKQFFSNTSNQGLDPPHARQDINNKENTMSDEKENSSIGESPNEEQKLSPRELAFKDTTWQRKVVADALKAGTLACLPGKDGYADTQPAVNLVSGKVYHGANLLYLKEHQRLNGYPTPEYVPSTQIDRAKKDHPELFIRKGERGVNIHWSEKNEDTGEWEDKSARLFNVAQLNKPALIKKWAEQQKLDALAENLEYKRSQYGTNWEPNGPREKSQGPDITCSSTEPKEYLGQYLAAVSMGSKFKVDPEQAKEFTSKMLDTLYEKTITPKAGDRKDELVADPFKLLKVSREASNYCVEFMKEMRSGPKQEQEQKQEHKRSRGR